MISSHPPSPSLLQDTPGLGMQRSLQPQAGEEPHRGTSSPKACVPLARQQSLSLILCISRAVVLPQLEGGRLQLQIKQA